MYSVIMAGRSDVRFWPLSRKNRPKQFLDVTGHGPMVLETYNRLAPVARDEEMIIVVGDEHLAEANRLFKGKKQRCSRFPWIKIPLPVSGLALSMPVTSAVKRQ